MKVRNILLIIFYLLIVLCKGYLFSIKYANDENIKEYNLFVESIKSVSDTKVSYNVMLLNTKSKFILNLYDNSYDNIQADLDTYAHYKYGDVIKVKGKITVPKLLKNPGEFNYKLYLYSNNIYGLINSYEEPEKISYDLNIIENILKKIYSFKDDVSDKIKNYMSEHYASVAISMIYGDRLNLDENIKGDFEELGVSHLMSVSGTHITSFMIIINTLLGAKKYNRKKYKKVKRRVGGATELKTQTKKIAQVIIQIVSIFTYIIFTGFGVSVLRAGLMLIISIICKATNTTNDKYKALLVTCILILFNTPYAIFNIGAELSFLATLGILMFSKHIVRLLNKLTSKLKNKVAKNIAMFLVENISITIAVQLMIIPIEINSFNRLPFPIVVPNLILGLISIPIRVMGTLGVMLSGTPIISSVIFVFVEVLVKILLICVNLLKEISFGISTASMPLIFYIIYYFLVLLLFIFFELIKVSSKEGKYNIKKLVSYIKKAILILFLLLIIISVGINIYLKYYAEFVYFFNVEQGDMSYIKCRKESAIVDIGSMKQSAAFNTISNYFKYINLNKVDAIIISHMHKDHVNGLEELLLKYDVGVVYYVRPKTIDEAYINFKRVLEENNVDSKEVREGDKIAIGKIQVEVLLPEDNYIQKDEVNANSLVCKININQKNLLYMGDANKEAEEKIIKQIKNKSLDLNNIYILKVGHHGSKSSTGEEFIQNVKPQIAVISACKRYYGHPHEITISTLKENKIYTYLTEKYGAIKFNLK